MYFLLSRLISNTILIAYFSLVLAWIHPQIFRFEAGHYNLSFAFVLLLTLLFLIRSYQKFYSDANITSELFWFIPVVIVSSFLHLYYLPLILVFVGFFSVAWIIKAYWQHAKYRVLLPWSLTLLLVPTVIVYALIRLIDGYYGLREPGAVGYYDSGTKLYLKALFTPYFLKDLGFYYPPAKPIMYEFGFESYAYLGSFALFAGFVLLIYALKYFFRKKTIIQKKSPGLQGFFVLFACAAIGSLFISPGDKIHFVEGDSGINNYLNIFRYMKQGSVGITHFRQMGRFSWFFFWFINLLIIYLYEKLLNRNQRQKITQISLYLLLGLAALDMLFVQIHYRKDLHPVTLTNPAPKEKPFFVAGWKSEDFQAILPLPFYYIGSEKEEYYFTVDNLFFLKTIQLSLTTRLPLMASYMSRSATGQVKALYETVTTGKISPSILPKLNQKPILVAQDTSFYNGKPNMYTETTTGRARTLFLAGSHFVSKPSLKYVGRYKNLNLYSWEFNRD